MSFEACARLVERSDPDRFLAVMAAPVDVRRVLFPLYAFNVEVARAPWVTEEPMIAEMRLQWWRDALEEIAAGGSVRKHEVTSVLADVLDADGARALDGLVAARRWDVYKDSFEDHAHFKEYINATSSELMWTAARLLGATHEAPIKRFAFGVGVANWLRAVPALEQKGRIPLVEGTPEAVATLAKAALRDLQSGAFEMGAVSPDVAAVLRSGWMAERILKAAAKAPQRVADGTLEPSPFTRKAGLLWRTVRGAY